MNTTGLQGSVPMVLAVQNEAFRERLVGLVQQIGYDVEQVGAPGIVYQLTREQYAKSWVILDTEDDVAWLVQLVNQEQPLDTLRGRSRLFTARCNTYAQ